MLREKVEKLNKKNVSYLATNIMNNAEMLFLKNEKTNIGRLSNDITNVLKIHI